jgi:hypothetical protein
MSGTPEGRTARVVLAARAASDAQRLLEEAAELARALHTELTGLFVEEADLLSGVGLPVTREVGLVSGAVRDIDAVATARELRRQADDVRVRLQRLATALGLPWSFRVERGDVLEVAVSAAASDLVILAPRTAAWQRVVGPPLAAAREPTVAALYDATDAGERALAAAFDLAAHRPDRVSLLLREGGRRGGRPGPGGCPPGTAHSPRRRRPGAGWRDAGAPSSCQWRAWIAPSCGGCWPGSPR